MKLAFIDCSIAGVSGDMLTAALIDAGAPAGKVKGAMLKAGKLFGDIEVGVKQVRVNEIKATRIEVKTEDEGGRTYREITGGLRKLVLPEQVRDVTFDALKTLAEAEAKVHGKPLSQLVLHEVGAADAIADIVGCCTAAYELGLLEREVLASEVAVGKGTTTFAHGRLPLPAPATLEILRGKPIRGVETNVELATPTGVALLVALADQFVDVYPPMRIDAVGYGAGARRLPSPSLVRVCLGEASGRGLKQEISVLETNVDDVSGEVIGYTIEKLLTEGALDASATPTLMKKGRPGFLIKVLTKPEDAERLARLLMLETGTLGVRVLPSVHRYALEREVVRVDLRLSGRKFKPRVKVARERGKLVGFAAEYEDVKQIAERTGIGLREVIGRVEEIARRKVR
ncbi:MAG: nickel pincer cofactor biosynthesis protein LarC [Candidatus Hadarchaeaceae archaeon]